MPADASSRRPKDWRGFAITLAVYAVLGGLLTLLLRALGHSGDGVIPVIGGVGLSSAVGVLFGWFKPKPRS